MAMEMEMERQDGEEEVIKPRPRLSCTQYFIPSDSATVWVPFLFSQMNITDKHLEIVGESHGIRLHTLMLVKCSGLSTDGLLHINGTCRALIEDGRWLHKVDLHNIVLQTLNFFMTDLSKIAPVYQMQQYYRLGTFDNCFQRWNALFDCLSLKTKRASEVEEILKA